MSKRQEIRARRKREQIRNRLVVILLVIGGAALIVFALILPSINNAKNQTVNAQVTPITPRAFSTTVKGLSLGDPNAPVKIDAWEDFQCVACDDYTKNVEPDIIKNLVETGKVYYTYHFYLIIDQGNPSGESHQAANAAMCANEQGRFWDYHDILVKNWKGENVGSYTDARLGNMAESIGLDLTAFNSCFKANKYKDQIDQDIQAGANKGVTGTPSIFVNGQIVAPGFIPTYDQIAQAVAAAGGQ